MRRYNIPLNLDDLIKRYAAGESENALAKSLGVSRYVIRRHLLHAGIQPRGTHEAALLRMGAMSAVQRQAQTAAAHAAVRGVSLSWEKQCAIARGRQESPGNVSPLELLLADYLYQRSVSFAQQTAIGPYNADFTSGSVAVEVFGGRWHFSGRHMLRAQERFRYLLDSGWHALVVVVTETFPLVPASADYIVAFLEETDRNPSMIRQYRMIGGGAEELVRQSADTDHLTVKYPRRRSRDRLGRYEGISG